VHSYFWFGKGNMSLKIPILLIKWFSFQVSRGKSTIRWPITRPDKKRKASTAESIGLITTASFCLQVNTAALAAAREGGRMMPLRGEKEEAKRSPRVGTRVSYRFLRAGRTGIGQLACGQPLCPQRCVGRASPATVLTPSPDVLGQHRRPQSPRSMGARGLVRVLRVLRIYLIILSLPRRRGHCLELWYTGYCP